MNSRKTRNSSVAQNQRRKKNKRGGGSHWNSQEARSGTISRPLIAPDELDTRLKFRKVGTFLNAVSPISAVELNPNCAYDVDPTLGSTETYGFDEYAALYSYYRVVGYSYRITIASSIQPNGIMVYLMNTNVTLPGTNYQLYTTQPYSHSTVLSAYGAQPTVFTGKILISTLTGTPSVEMADSFRSVTTSVPSDKVFLTLAVEALDGASTVYGVTYDIQLTMDIRFYSREVDLTLGAFMRRLNTYGESRAGLDAKKRESSKKTPPPQEGNAGGISQIPHDGTVLTPGLPRRIPHDPKSLSNDLAARYGLNITVAQPQASPTGEKVGDIQNLLEEDILKRLVELNNQLAILKGL